MKFIKLYNNVLCSEFYINVNTIESVFSKDGVTHICSMNDSTGYWEVQETVDEVMQKIQEAE